MRNVIAELKKIKLLALDFDGVMTDNKLIVDENGKESVICNRADGLGIEMLKKNTNIDVIVISKEKNKVVASRCKKLKIRCIHGLDDKITKLKAEVADRNLSLDQVCYVGNDINDIECLQQAGVSIAIADSYPEVLKTADLVTTKKGGDGAVRQICDWILGCEEIQ